MKPGSSVGIRPPVIPDGRVRVLSFAGGGVGGALSAEMLRVLDTMHGHPLTIASAADLIIGTSAGGLIALMLAAGRSAAEAVALFRDRSKEIFGSSRRRLWPPGLWFPGLWRAKHAPDGLRQVLNEVFGTATLGDLPRPVAVTTYNGLSASALWGLSSRPEVLSNLDCRTASWTVVDAALATTAAPIYLPAHAVDGVGRYVDGGIFAATPTLIGVAMVLHRFAGLRPVALTFGTGRQPSAHEFGDWGVWQWLSGSRLLRTVLSSQSDHSEIVMALGTEGESRARLINPPTADYRLDDWRAVPRLLAQAGNRPTWDCAEDVRWLRRRWFGLPAAAGDSDSHGAAADTAVGVVMAEKAGPQPGA